MDSKTFIDKISEKLQTDQETVEELIFRLTEVMGDELLDANQIVTPVLGSFESRKRLERVTVHPSTGKKLLVPPKVVVSFRPAPSLKLKVK